MKNSANLTRAALTALLITPVFWVNIDHQADQVVHASSGGSSAHAGGLAANGSSVVRGAICGVIPKISSGTDGRPSAPGEFQAARLDREFQDLVTSLRRASRSGRAGHSLPEALWEYLTVSDPGSESEDGAWLSEFERFSLQPGSVRVSRSRFPGGARGSSDGSAEAMAAWSTNLLAAMNRSESGAPEENSFGSTLVPINVNTATLETDSSAGSGVSTGYWSTPGANPVADPGASAPEARNWTATVPASMSGSNATWNESANGGPMISVGPLATPALSAWSRLVSYQAPVSRGSLTSESWTGAIGPSPVLQSLSAPPVSTRIVLASVLLSGSNLATNTRSPATSGTSSGAVSVSQPIVPADLSTPNIYVSAQAGTVGEYSSTTGAAVNASLITGLNLPQGLAISGNTLYVSYNTGIPYNVGEYNATTGAAINASFITGLNYRPYSIVLSGNSLYIAAPDSNTVGEYNATTGAAINASFITGLNQPNQLALSGNNLYVSIYGTNAIGEYNATTGAPINASLITGLDEPFGLTLSGNNLYVGNVGNDTVGEYDATTGAAINASLITSLDFPQGLAISGNNLYVALYGSDAIGEYNATTGAAINASFVAGLSAPEGLLIVPEPGSAFLLGLGLPALLGAVRLRKRTS